MDSSLPPGFKSCVGAATLRLKHQSKSVQFRQGYAALAIRQRPPLWRLSGSTCRHLKLHDRADLTASFGRSTAGDHRSGAEAHARLALPFNTFHCLSRFKNGRVGAGWIRWPPGAATGASRPTATLPARQTVQQTSLPAPPQSEPFSEYALGTACLGSWGEYRPPPLPGPSQTAA